MTIFTCMLWLQPGDRHWASWLVQAILRELFLEELNFGLIIIFKNFAEI